MIEARGLVKRYGSTTAVDNLSFDVLPGMVTGFLGPNGAGKSTTMRMILGLDRPDAGTVRINGKNYRDLRCPLREVGALLAAKAAVLGAVTLVAGEVLAFTAFAVGEAVLRSPAPHATLGQPGVLRAVLMAGAYPALIALIGLGLGAVIRHTAGAICAVVGILFVLPLIVIPMGTSVQDAVEKFLPMMIAENSLTAVKPVAHSLSPGLGFGMLCFYTVAALAVGSWLLARRDA
jgi:energy-coupling factor transporter ATP-binding protein EcfA2